MSRDMARETEPLAEVSRLFDQSINGNLRAGGMLAGDEFSGGPRQVFAEEQPMQANGLLEHAGAVSQPTGTETEPKPLRRGPAQEQEKAMKLPHVGPADVTPECFTAGRGVVVVGAGERPAHGEGPQEPSRTNELGDDKPAEVCRTSVLETQKRLAEKAVREPEHRFGHLYDLLTWEPILDAAATRLLGNKGSRTPGLDGIDRDKLRRNREHHLAILREQLKRETFQPTPVKRVYIPKRNGKMRPLGIPTLYDRWVQMAIKMVLEPIFESDFAQFSHGFRPGRSCHTAMGHIHRLTVQRRRKVYWVIEGDIEGFFDHVHHKKLMTLLRQRIQDQRLLDLIWSFLRAGVMEGQLFKKTNEGTPQGGVLSPLLANIYLNHFDQWFTKQAMLGEHASKRERNRKAGHANYMMVRYADDFVVFSNGTKEETEAFQADMQQWFADELKLALSEEKTKLTHYTDGFNFLGYTFKKTAARAKAPGGTTREVVVTYPSTQSVQRAVHRISDLTERSTLMHSPEDQIEALNAFLRGWGEYFRHSSAKATLRYVGSRAYMRMWKWLQAKSEMRHGWQTIKAQYGADNTWNVNGHTLVKPGYMPIGYPRYKAIPHPYLSGQPVEEPAHYDPFMNSWTGNQAYGPDWRAAKDEATDRTQGTCAICGKPGVEVNHITRKRSGGGNVPTNLIPLCRTHHRQAERRNSQVSHQLREINKAILGSGEPDAMKVARPVRGEVL